MMNIMFKLIKKRKTNMMQNLKWWTWKKYDMVKKKEEILARQPNEELCWMDFCVCWQFDVDLNNENATILHLQTSCYVC